MTAFVVSVAGAVLLALGAGLSFVVQQAVNANLRAGLGSAAWAGFVSYLGGTLCMLALAAALREPVPSLARLQASHWWAWSGGFFGAIYIAISILLVPRLGAAAFVALAWKMRQRSISTETLSLAGRHVP
jgi:transporter family-2 protein